MATAGEIRVHVKNLSFSVSESRLRNLLRQQGLDVSKIFLVRRGLHYHAQAMCSAFIHVKSEKQLEDVVQALNGKWYDSLCNVKTLEASRAIPRINSLVPQAASSSQQPLVSSSGDAAAEKAVLEASSDKTAAADRCDETHNASGPSYDASVRSLAEMPMPVYGEGVPAQECKREPSKSPESTLLPLPRSFGSKEEIPSSGSEAAKSRKRKWRKR